ncbi:MAG: efflux RND transporter periplasmic adaptor subunit [Candidatus Binataceae bacterium]
MSHAPIPLPVVCVVAALALVAGCQRAPVAGAAADTTPSLPRLEKQSDGTDALRFSPGQLHRMTFATVKELPLPAVLEANGQVTFDDRRVATIISRVTGRIDELRTSQWDTVRHGEQVMSLYSPDLMTAEAEYLEATSSASQTGRTGSQTDIFGMPAGSLGMTANLKAAAVRKLELLGFSPADVAAIRTPSASVWMRAPISGIVVSKNVVRGQQVNPGDQLFSLATLEQVWITADIYEDDLSRVHVGQTLQAVTTAYPDEMFSGVIDRISPNIDPNTHTLELRCRIMNRGLKLKPQMLARIRIVTKSGYALVVDERALVFDTDRYYAFVLAPGKVIVRREVAIRSWNERGYARVVHGLSVGDRVVAAQSVEVDSLWDQSGAEDPASDD